MHKNHFTRLGFILAAAGSAVGLGNIWKFPYIAGDNGGIPNIEQVADTGGGGRGGALDAGGLIDLAVGTTLF